MLKMLWRPQRQASAIFFCLVALLCALDGHAFAGAGIGGEWVWYGEQDAAVRIDEAAGILEDGSSRTRYVLLEAQGDRRRAVRQRVRPGDARDMVRVHEDLLLFLGVKNPILVRRGTPFHPPREKIRGRWQYAAQLNETFYYNAEFDLDARTVADITRPESGELARNAGRPLEFLLDAQVECALRSGDAVYHFTRLGADFLVLEPSYARSSRNGYKILMVKAPAPGTAQRTKPKRRAYAHPPLAHP
jgi:hypothetical protein